MSTVDPDSFEHMIQVGNWVILDTETTGLRYPSEICQIAIIDPHGRTLLDELVKTWNPIPLDATRIHGITNFEVQNKRTWNTVFPEVAQILKGKDLVIYNAGYDTKVMDWSCKIAGIPYEPTWHREWCAMLWYADIWGEKDSYYQTNRWQRLSTAAAQQKLLVKDAHNALGDCLMTLGLINKLAKVQP